MPRVPTVSHTPMKWIRASYEYARRNKVDATPLGLSAELRYRTQASSIRLAFSRRKMPQLRTRPARLRAVNAPRLNPYSRPARISSIASAPARSMLAGSSVIPSIVVTSVAFGSTSPSSTSCTDTGSLSGSWPSEKVKQPCGSRSTSSTRRPVSTIAAPSDATVVVLATPPFWLATANTRVLVTVPSWHACPPRASGDGPGVSWGRIGRHGLVQPPTTAAPPRRDRLV